MYFTLGDLTDGKKPTRVVDIRTNEQNSLTQTLLKKRASIMAKTMAISGDKLAEKRRPQYLD
jgi:hypothetical protein